MLSVSDSWLLVGESDFRSCGDDINAAKEVCDQSSLTAFPLFAHCVISWFTAMIEQLKAPRASVPLPGCAIHKQFVVQIKLALRQAVIQEVHRPRPKSFNGAEVYCQQCAGRNPTHCYVSLSKLLHTVVQSQVEIRVVVHFSTKVLKTEEIAIIGDLRFVRMKSIQEVLQCVTIFLPNRLPYSI